jgi:thioredoxin-related protein
MIKFHNDIVSMAACFLIGTMLFVGYVEALPFSLKPLKTGYVAQYKQVSTLATLVMIYQPDCAWCKKQGKLLAKVFEQCKATLNPVLIGTKGNARKLKKELKHYHKGISAFMADRQFLWSIGGYQASPTLLIFDTSGDLIAKKRGYIAKDKLASALKLLTNGKCKI